MYLVNIRGRSHVAPGHRQVPRDVGTPRAGTPRGPTLRCLVVLKDRAAGYGDGEEAASGSWPLPYPAARSHGVSAARQRPRGPRRAGPMNGGDEAWLNTDTTITTATTST